MGRDSAEGGIVVEYGDGGDGKVGDVGAVMDPGDCTSGFPIPFPFKPR